MKTLRISKLLRALNVNIEQLELISGTSFNPNDKIVIGLESDMPKECVTALSEYSIDQLSELSNNINKELELRAKQEIIREYETYFRNSIRELRKLGVTSVLVDENLIYFE